MPVDWVPPVIPIVLPVTRTLRSRYRPQGPSPRVRDWIETPLTLPDTVLFRTVTFDEVLTLMPPPSHSDVPEPRPVPKPLPVIVLFSITPLRLISNRIPSAALPVILFELITRPS